MSSLHAYLSKLRAVLAGAAEPTIIRRLPGYLLNVSPQHIDITHFLTAGDHARTAALGADNPFAPSAPYANSHRRAVRAGTPASAAARVSGTPSCR